MFPMTHWDFQVYDINIKNSHNVNNTDEFDVVVSHPLTITSVLI